MLLFSQAGASQFTQSLSFGGSQSQRSGVGGGGDVMATQQARNKPFFIFRAATLREVQTPWQHGRHVQYLLLLLEFQRV